MGPQVRAHAVGSAALWPRDHVHSARLLFLLHTGPQVSAHAVGSAALWPLEVELLCLLCWDAR